MCACVQQCLNSSRLCAAACATWQANLARFIKLLHTGGLTSRHCETAKVLEIMLGEGVGEEEQTHAGPRVRKCKRSPVLHQPGRAVRLPRVFSGRHTPGTRTARTPSTAQCECLKTQPHSRPGVLTPSPTAEQAKHPECQASRAAPLHRTGMRQGLKGYHLAVWDPTLARERTKRANSADTHSPWRPAAAAAAHVRGACACSAGACSGCGQQQPEPAATEQVQQTSSGKQGVSMVSTTPSAPGHCNCWWWLLNMSAAGALPASRPKRCVCFSCTATCKASSL